jgi:hypothetical protein
LNRLLFFLAAVCELILQRIGKHCNTTCALVQPSRLSSPVAATAAATMQYEDIDHLVIVFQDKPNAAVLFHNNRTQEGVVRMFITCHQPGSPWLQECKDHARYEVFKFISW